MFIVIDTFVIKIIIFIWHFGNFEHFALDSHHFRMNCVWKDILGKSFNGKRATDYHFLPSLAFEKIIHRSFICVFSLISSHLVFVVCNFLKLNIWCSKSYLKLHWCSGKNGMPICEKKNTNIKISVVKADNRVVRRHSI